MREPPSSLRRTGGCLPKHSCDGGSSWTATYAHQEQILFCVSGPSCSLFGLLRQLAGVFVGLVDVFDDGLEFGGTSLFTQRGRIGSCRAKAGQTVVRHPLILSHDHKITHDRL